MISIRSMCYYCTARVVYIDRVELSSQNDYLRRPIFFRRLRQRKKRSWSAYWVSCGKVRSKTFLATSMMSTYKQFEFGLFCVHEMTCTYREPHLYSHHVSESESGNKPVLNRRKLWNRLGNPASKTNVKKQMTFKKPVFILFHPQVCNFSCLSLS